MNETLLHDAYIAWMSDITTKTGNEIHWKNEYGEDITVEPVDMKECRYIVRKYYDNGQKYWEIEYKDNKLHGKDIAWYKNGQKMWEKEYKDNKKQGKSISWYENGQKWWEVDYLNGQCHGKGLRWHKNGQKYWETDYLNGQRHGKGLRWYENSHETPRVTF